MRHAKFGGQPGWLSVAGATARRLCLAGSGFLYGVAGVQPADMAAVGASTFEVAAAEPDVAAIVGYLWPNALDLPEQAGARGLPASVRAFSTNLGHAVIAAR